MDVREVPGEHIAWLQALQPPGHHTPLLVTRFPSGASWFPGATRSYVCWFSIMDRNRMTCYQLRSPAPRGQYQDRPSLRVNYREAVPMEGVNLGMNTAPPLRFLGTSKEGDCMAEIPSVLCLQLLWPS